MGLDIYAYSNIEKVENVQFDIDGDPTDPIVQEQVDDGDLRRFFLNPYFDGRHGDISGEHLYRFQEREHSLQIGYMLYGRFRKELAKLAGYPKVEYMGEFREDAAAWDGSCAGMPFEPLINFSDCEGTIGSEVCSSLLADFNNFEEKAKDFSEEYKFFENYMALKKAFEIGSRNGAVVFS